VGPRAGLDGRKISYPQEFDPGPSSLQSIAIPTELPGLQKFNSIYSKIHKRFGPRFEVKFPFSEKHKKFKARQTTENASLFSAS